MSIHKNFYEGVLLCLGVMDILVTLGRRKIIKIVNFKVINMLKASKIRKNPYVSKRKWLKTNVYFSSQLLANNALIAKSSLVLH